jgi:L-cysteine S-thiosulfotransferase
MSKSRIFACVAAAMCLSALAAGLPAGNAYAAECKRKSAGFYLEDMNVSEPHNLRASLQDLPGSLTGVPGNEKLGRDVFISPQKGGCTGCHRLGSLESAIPQGTIGPALDGAGVKYSEAELREVLIKPGSLFPGTVMPSYHQARGEESVLTAAEIEDLVAFLATLK